MVLSSMQLQKVSVTLWFRRLQCLVLRSVLSDFINLRSAECVCSCYGLRVCSQTNKLEISSSTIGARPCCSNKSGPVLQSLHSRAKLISDSVRKTSKFTKASAQNKTSSPTSNIRTFWERKRVVLAPTQLSGALTMKFAHLHNSAVGRPTFTRNVLFSTMAYQLPLCCFDSFVSHAFLPVAPVCRFVAIQKILVWLCCVLFFFW